MNSMRSNKDARASGATRAAGALCALVVVLVVAGGASAATAASPVSPRPNPDGPSATPVVRGAPEPAPRRGARFCALLKSHLNRGSGSGGLMVLDPVHRTVLCTKSARAARPLASNMKLFTTATALTMFGANHRFATRIYASGNLDRRGVLHGNLYLKGAGDPALGSPAFYNRFTGIGTNMFALANQVKRSGIKRVTGRLLADDTIFDRRRGVADSGYATSSYIGPLSGLAFNEGYSSSSGYSFASDPAKLAVKKLALSIRKRGVQISTSTGLGRLPRSGALQIGVVLSPKMTELVNETDVQSNNFYAEMLIKGIGARFAKRGTTAGGAAVVERFARRHKSRVHAVDGSGLTRGNSASPANVVRLLQTMQGERVGKLFASDLALAGREGTVADRMRGTPAEGRCRTKTGTISGVSNLSGYCFNKSGRTMIFSILMSNVGDVGRAHREQDRIAALVAGR